MSNKCTACSGSGIYDNHGSPPCGACNGTGYKGGPEELRATILQLENELLAALESADTMNRACAQEILEREHLQRNWETMVNSVKHHHEAQLAAEEQLRQVTGERDHWLKQAMRDPTGLSQITWRECYAQLAEINQKHLLERDSAWKEMADLRDRCDRLAESKEGRKPVVARGWLKSLADDLRNYLAGCHKRL